MANLFVERAVPAKADDRHDLRNTVATRDVRMNFILPNFRLYARSKC